MEVKTNNTKKTAYSHSFLYGEQSTNKCNFSLMCLNNMIINRRSNAIGATSSQTSSPLFDLSEDRLVVGVQSNRLPLSPVDFYNYSLNRIEIVHCCIKWT